MSGPRNARELKFSEIRSVEAFSARAFGCRTIYLAIYTDPYCIDIVEVSSDSSSASIIDRLDFDFKGISTIRQLPTRNRVGTWELANLRIANSQLWTEVGSWGLVANLRIPNSQLWIVKMTSLFEDIRFDSYHKTNCVKSDDVITWKEKLRKNIGC